jgi:hypothetical protein
MVAREYAHAASPSALRARSAQTEPTASCGTAAVRARIRPLVQGRGPRIDLQAPSGSVPLRTARTGIARRWQRALRVRAARRGEVPAVKPVPLPAGLDSRQARGPRQRASTGRAEIAPIAQPKRCSHMLCERRDDKNDCGVSATGYSWGSELHVSPWMSGLSASESDLLGVGDSASSLACEDAISEADLVSPPRAKASSASAEETGGIKKMVVVADQE